MSERIVVPEERKKRIIARANEAMHGPVEADEAAVIIDAFAEDIAENPIVPTDEQLREVHRHFGFHCNDLPFLRAICGEFQRRMFRAPEPNPAIRDLLWEANPYPNTGAEYRHDEAVREAYRRGQKAGSK